MLKRMSFLSGLLMAIVSANSAHAVGSANPLCVANEHTLAYYCPAEASGTVGGVKKLLNSVITPYGTIVTVPSVDDFTNKCITPNDMRFDGWTDTSGKGYVVGSTFDMPDNDLALTALYIDNYAASIVYNTDGGIINNATYSNSCTTTSLDIVLPTDVTRTGYTFNGWYADNEFKTKVTAIDKADCQEGATINLYASWTANTIRVMFDANGASGTNVAGREFEYDAQSYAPGAGYLVKTNHVFLGWNTDKNATVAQFKANDSIKNINNGGEITLYAVWAPCDAAFVGNNVDTAELVGVDGNVCQYKHVCKTGYYNANHDKTITSNQISCSACTNLPANAVWTGAATSDTCAWDCDACVVGNNAADCNVTKNESARTCSYAGTCNANTFKPTVNGVTVSCSSCPANSTTVDKNTAASCDCIANYSVGGTMAGTTTTTATQCSPIAYTIVYELGGGTNYTNAPNTYTYGAGATIDGMPELAGYIFGGWCDTDGKNCDYTRTIGATSTGVKTFVAKWTKASCNATNATASAAVADNTVVCSVTCNYGFTQGGAGDTTTAFTVTGDKNVATVNVECKSATHTITINKNGGSGNLTVDNNVSSGADNLVITCNHGTKIELPAWGGAVNALTKTNSVFTGWDNTSIVCDGDKTVNAQWAECGTCVKGTGVESCAVNVSNNTCVASVTQCQSGYDSTKAGCDGMNCSCDASNITCAAGEYLVAGATSCAKCVAGNYCAGGTYVFSTTTNQGMKSCPNGYANSEASSNEITDCFSDTKTRAWTGKQVNGDVPENCSAVTEWNACSIDVCDYVAFSNAAGTGDGEIKSGCPTNNKDCTKTVKSVTANKNAYVNGTTCAVCAAPYAMSDGGNITSDKCYGTFEKSGVQVQGTVPTNCSAVTAWNTCNPGTCEYTKYANGDIKADCVPKNCTQTPKTVTANAGAYINGTACEMCPSEYPESAGGAIESGMCYRACMADDVDGAASVTGTATKGGTKTCKATSCVSGRYFENGACKTLDGYTCPGGTFGKDKCYKSCKVSCVSQTCPTNAATCTNGTETATGTEYYGGACDATAPTCSLVVNKCKSGFLLKNNACTACPANATCDGSSDWVCDTNYDKTNTGCSLGVFTCTPGKAADGSPCAPGSYCPGGDVAAGMENDTNTGCERTCPAEFASSDTGANNENACYQMVTVSTGVVPTNCADATWNECKYKDYYGVEDTACTPTVKSVTANKNAYINGTSCAACAAPYTMSDGGNITADACYGTFEKSGIQVQGNVPGNCSAVTEWNTCDPETCEYTKYANGDIKADCTPANCTQTPKTVTANPGAYVSGVMCKKCLGHTYSVGGTATSCENCDAGYTVNDDNSMCSPNAYTVTYSCGEGTLVSGAELTQNIVYNDKFTTRPAAICERKGYTFVRWNGEYSKADTNYTYTTVGNTTLTAQWTVNNYSCDSGMYLPAGATTCATCTAGSYCAGGTYMFNATAAQGIMSCPDIAPNSDTGMNTVSQCYGTCSVPANVNAVVGRDYYGTDTTDTCQIQTCKSGYYLNDATTACVLCAANSVCDAASGSDMNLDNVPDGTPVTCDELTRGTHPLSNAGTTSVTKCYGLCEEYEILGGTAIPKSDTVYYNNKCTYRGVSNTGNPCNIEMANGVEVCVEFLCNSEYEMVNGVCQLCNRDNATAYKPDGNCQIAKCHTGYHPEADQCVEDIQACIVTNAISAYKIWDAKRGVFGECQIEECADGYHNADNTCVADVQECDLAHGSGVREWNHRLGAWDECIATSCDAGYTSDKYDSIDPTQQCGRCKNSTGVMGEPAVSSYARGCEIASCMYQGELYKLENNECVPICPPEDNPYEDETGTMYWDAGAKKCKRECFEGYMSW